MTTWLQNFGDCPTLFQALNKTATVFALILFWNLHFFAQTYLQYLLHFTCLPGVGRRYKKVEPVAADIEDHHVHVLLPGSKSDQVGPGQVE